MQKVIIIDDEAAGRSLIREYLAEYPALIVVGEANYGIGALEARLNPQHFLRVHRSDIVNLHYIREIQKYPSSYDVILQNGDVVRVSRSYMDKIRELTF